MNTDIRPPSDSASARPAPRARRARRVLGIFPLMLGFISGILLCACALVVLTLLHGTAAQRTLPSPQTSADKVCAALQQQDYATFYGLLSSGQRATGTQGQFASSQRQLDIAEGYARQCGATVRLVDGEQASVEFTVTRAGSGAINGTARMVYEQGAWRLDAYDARVL